MTQLPKRLIKNWMGEDWTLHLVGPNDSRLVNPVSKEKFYGHTDFEENSIVVGVRGQNSDITTLLHEVMHRALDSLRQDSDGGNDDKPTELRIEWAALCVRQFLEKRGIDLSPLVE